MFNMKDTRVVGSRVMQEQGRPLATGAAGGARRRISAGGLALAVLAWAAGCATAPAPAIEPAFAARSYTPLRVAMLPPDVFVVLDQVGDNDPAKSEALRQMVSTETVKMAAAALRHRGYDVDFSARWDGVFARDGSLLVTSEELAWMANGVLQFGNSAAGRHQGPFAAPEIVAPELAAKIGWATSSDAVLYMNVKGVTMSNGKRTAQVLSIVLVVVVIAVIILALMASSKGGKNNNSGGGMPGAGGGRSVVPGARAAPAVRGAPGAGVVPTAPVRGGLPPTGRGLPPPGRTGRVYGGGPRLGLGVGLYVPLGGPVHTHDGRVEHQDELYGGDELWVSMTLVNAADGRVLWHLREELDLEADKPEELEAMVQRFVGTIPLRGGL
jgi:hypothetical protein